jgi:uncharacterized membrane protein (DUF373 family)
MPWASRKDKILSMVEVVTVTALQFLLVMLVVVATVTLFVLFATNLSTTAQRIESVSGLLTAMQESFGGILIVLLGLELLETLKSYFVDHHIRLEVILVVALIAVGRHVIHIDFAHTPGPVLLGLSSVIASLTLGYYLVKKSQAAAKAEQRESNHDKV